MIVLGIETSCDETAAAVVADDGRILSNVVLSQLDEHTPYGGVVPEIAARSHLAHIDTLVERALAEAGVDMAGIDAVAATGGPGLIGGVIVGAMVGKAIALARDIPFVAVNHLEAHALTARLTDDVAFPYLLLLVSGGHCQLLAVGGVGRYRLLGTTIDDAAGEAFDKVAKMLGLGFPGGPAVQRAAERGDPGRFALPRPMKGKPGCDFSFSGLKTAVRQAIEGLPPGPVDERDAADIAAAFQAALVEAVRDRVGRGLDIFSEKTGETRPRLVVAGGVAANAALRAGLDALCTGRGAELIVPPVGLCTDNAAMVAWAGIERLKAGDPPSPMDFKPRPRWPLDPDAPKRGQGVG